MPVSPKYRLFRVAILYDYQLVQGPRTQAFLKCTLRVDWSELSILTIIKVVFLRTACISYGAINKSLKNIIMQYKTMFRKLCLRSLLRYDVKVRMNAIRADRTYNERS